MGAALEKAEKLKANLNTPRNEEKKDENVCSQELSQCADFVYLAETLKTYAQHSKRDIDIQRTAFLEHLNSTKLVDSFTHLMYVHETQFEEISNAFPAECELASCRAFQRNHRDRSIATPSAPPPDEKKADELLVSLHAQLLDKIHCYFLHSFDIGHRLTRNDEHSIVECMQNEDEIDMDRILRSQRVMKLMQILATKHALYRRLNGRDRTNKYVQAVTFQIDGKTDDDELEDDEKKTADEANENASKQTYAMFDYGVSFRYTKKALSPTYTASKNEAYVRPKYANIGEEVQQNPYCTLTALQFKLEWTKARTHFASAYCKQIIAAYQANENNGFNLKAIHLLAVLIYCNYDRLSYEFSKTYRRISKAETVQDIVNRHRNFWHLGVCLKQIVNEFKFASSTYSPKTKMYQMNFKTLFHGVNQPMMFDVRSPGFTDIEVPLSTSSQLSVASQFATTNGLIIEVSAGGWMAACFQCDWLSDYPSEREHLFLQNERHLSFRNVIECASYIEFECIIVAVRQLREIWDHNKSKYRENITALQKAVTVALIQNETGIRKWPSFHEYATTLFHNFCVQQWAILIDWDLINGNYSFLFEHLCFRRADLEWIDSQKLFALFPNAQVIGVHNVLLSDKIIEWLYVFLQEQQDRVVEFYMPQLKNSRFKIKAFVSKYAKKFEEIQFSMHQTGKYQRTKHDAIYISNLCYDGNRNDFLSSASN